ncbi:class I SAM-dependent methyltransferase [Nocardioides pyridinolyticus]
MPVMSAIEGAFCRSASWRSFARRKVLPWALDGHRLSGDVLEIGGGSGAMAAGIARTFSDVRLTVTDVDTAMVDAARRRLSSYTNVTVEAADVTALPFADASFDAVTSYLMLHHVINWLEALAETARVLRPGGAIIGYDLTDSRIARWVHKADGSPHRIIAADELADGLAVAGFTEITVRPSFAGQLMRFHAHQPTGR